MTVAIGIQIVVGIAHGLGLAPTQHDLEPDRLERVVVVAVDHTGRAGDALPGPQPGLQAAAVLILDEHIEQPLEHEEGLFDLMGVSGVPLPGVHKHDGQGVGACGNDAGIVMLARATSPDEAVLGPAIPLDLGVLEGLPVGHPVAVARDMGVHDLLERGIDEFGRARMAGNGQGFSPRIDQRCEPKHGGGSGVKRRASRRCIWDQEKWCPGAGRRSQRNSETYPKVRQKRLPQGSAASRERCLTNIEAPDVDCGAGKAGNELEHTVAVLACTAGCNASKSHRYNPNGRRETTAPNFGKFFKFEEHRVWDIHQLHQLLESLASEGDKFIIRGHRNPDASIHPNGIVRRLSRARPSENEPVPHFLEQPRRWLLLDFDGVENCRGLDATSSDAMEHLRTLLPAEFHDVTCSYNLSASAGLSDSGLLSGHLWFFLDRALGKAELDSWLGELGIDPALFRTVQPHLVAAPRFAQPLEDPVRIRKGLLPGRQNVVEVPKIEIPRSSGRPKEFGTGGIRGARGYEERMARLGDGPGKDGCHSVITGAIASYLSRHGPNADREALKADIRERVTKARWDRSKHPEYYVAHEVSDEVLDRSIQDWIDKAMPRGEGFTPTPKLGLEEARSKLGQEVDRWVDQAERWNRLRYFDRECLGFFGRNEASVRTLFQPPRHEIDAQVGLGKTEAYLSRVPRLLQSLRPEHCIVIAVPNHALSAELKKRALNDHGVATEVYLGPAQPDPNRPNIRMCRLHEQRAIFQAAGVANELCKVCPHQAYCGFLKQRSRKSPVWIVSHQIIYRPRKAPLPPIDHLIVDENPLAAGLEGADPQRPKRTSSEDLPPEISRCFDALPLDRHLSRNDFRISDAELRKIIEKSYAQIQTVEFQPESADQGIAQALETARQNARLIEEAKFFHAIMSGSTWGMRAKIDERGFRVVDWIHQRRIHTDFDVPTLFLDATAPLDAKRAIIDCPQAALDWVAESWRDEDGSIVFNDEFPFDPVIRAPCVIRAETPHVRHRQILFSAAQSKFQGPSGERNVAKIQRYVEARSFAKNRVLVVCQLALEEKLKERGLPPNVEMAHFNALRGRDEWNDVDVLIVIGRPQPPPSPVELHAEALFSRTCKSLGPDYYDRIWTHLTGTQHEMRAERHPDEYVETLRKAICEAELIQAIGRARGVNRSETNPLEIDLINQVPLPDIDIHEILSWEDARPDPGEIIAGRHGLLLPNHHEKGMANILQALLPDLYRSVATAKHAQVYSRPRSPKENSQIDVLLREYTAGAGMTRPETIAIKAAGCRYALVALATRPPKRRVLEVDEDPPVGADITEDGVLAYGRTYVLRQIPRRSRAKAQRLENMAEEMARNLGFN